METFVGRARVSLKVGIIQDFELSHGIGQLESSLQDGMRVRMEVARYIRMASIGRFGWAVREGWLCRATGPC